MKVSDLFVKSLESEGVQYIFGVPGEENEDLVNEACQHTYRPRRTFVGHDYMSQAGCNS